MTRTWASCFCGAGLLAGSALHGAAAATLDPIFANAFESGLTAFGPPLSALPLGATAAATTPVALQVTLDQAAAAPTFVPVVSSQPALLQVVGGGATVATGQTSASVLLNALATANAPVTLWARYGNTLGASVRVEFALNETGVDEEADYCVLQYPATLSVPAGFPAPLIYGRLYETGSTETAGPDPTWLAQAGYGPAGSDPRNLTAWSFSDASYNLQIGNDDEYQAALTAPSTVGSYAYAFRFSRDGGYGWTYCDLDGAGQGAGLSFQTTQLGAMTVTPAYPNLLINEVDYDNVGTDLAEYVEIYNGGSDAVSLQDVSLVLVNGGISGGAVYATYPLAALGTLQPGQYAVIGASSVVGMLPPGVPGLDLGNGGNLIQNGAPDGMALVDAGRQLLIDSLSYEGSLTAVPIAGFSAPVNLVDGTALSAAVADSNTVPGTLCRLPNGADTHNDATDWALCSALTPGGPNQN